MPPRFLSRDLVGEIVSDTQTAAAAQMTATLAGAPGLRTFLSGFTLTGAGATGASVVELVAAGLKYKVAVPAGATAALPVLAVTFDPAVPATAENTSITVVCPSLGAGNLHASLSVTGYRA